MRRKEQAAKRKAVETGKLDAEGAGGAKRQRMWVGGGDCAWKAARRRERRACGGRGQ